MEELEKENEEQHTHPCPHLHKCSFIQYRDGWKDRYKWLSKPIREKGSKNCMPLWISNITVRCKRSYRFSQLHFTCQNRWYIHRIIQILLLYKLQAPAEAWLLFSYSWFSQIFFFYIVSNFLFQEAAVLFWRILQEKENKKLNVHVILFRFLYDTIKKQCWLRDLLMVQHNQTLMSHIIQWYYASATVFVMDKLQ